MWTLLMREATTSVYMVSNYFSVTLHLITCSHIPAIQEVLHCARCELELEEQFYKIEEEWSEKVLTFQSYKSHGSSVLLSVDHAHSLIEQLEHTQIQLATMLMSKYIQPLKDEAAQWAAKLASVSDILQKVNTYR